MGVAVVFTIYVAAIAIATVPAMIAGFFLGRILSRGTYGKLRRRFQIAGLVLPPLAAGYVIFTILAMAAFGLVTHRDFGFGDGFELPLNNGYQFSAIDIPDIATLYRRGNGIISDGSLDQIARSTGPVVDNVFALQQSDDWIYGSRGTSNPRFADNKRVPDRWFLLNTRSLSLREVNSESAFDDLLRSQHLDVSVRPSEEFYANQRYRWYDAVVLLLLAVPPVLVSIALWQIVKRMRRGAASASEGDDVAESEIRYPGFLRRGRFLR